MYSLDDAYEVGLQQHVDKFGIAAMPTWWLRDGTGAAKLGVNVCAGIRASLQEMGLGHWPELRADQDWLVFVFRKGSGYEELLRAAHNPSEESCKKLRLAFAHAANAED